METPQRLIRPTAPAAWPRGPLRRFPTQPQLAGAATT